MPIRHEIIDRMALLTVLHYPDPRLRKVALPVQQVDASVRRLADDLIETMYSAKGIGLAATQVDVQKQVLVIDISDEKNQPQVFINPQLLSCSGQSEREEGCLSVPGFYGKVTRASAVHVQALNRDGTPFELQLEGLFAVCLQHEIDHLKGQLFVDHLSALKRDRLLKKLEKQARTG